MCAWMHPQGEPLWELVTCWHVSCVLPRGRAPFIPMGSRGTEGQREPKATQLTCGCAGL